MAEIMRRIAELRAFKFALLYTNVAHPEVLPAALDWLESEIAEHEREIDALASAA